MKKQVKSSLFAVAVGLSLSSAMLFNAGQSIAAHQPRVLKAPPTASPVAANTTAKPPQLPVTFYLTLISCMANGGVIDANIFIPEKQASIWDDQSEWRPER